MVIFKVIFKLLFKIFNIRSHPPGNENARGSNTIIISGNLRKEFFNILDSNTTTEPKKIYLTSKIKNLFNFH